MTNSADPDQLASSEACFKPSHLDLHCKILFLLDERVNNLKLRRSALKLWLAHSLSFSVSDLNTKFCFYLLWLNLMSP